MEQGYGMRICTARRARGMTQAQLCAAAGVGAITVSMWENEKTRPQAESWHKLAASLQVSVHWLKHGREIQQPAIGSGQWDLSAVSLESIVHELARRGYAVIAANVGPRIPS